MEQSSSGTNGIKNENSWCGVGFIIIPSGIDPDVYRADCYRTGRISIFGGYGHSNFYDILIDSEALQEIEFPEKQGAMGSPVVWVNIPKHNMPVVIASLKYDQQISFGAEFSKKISRKYKQNIVNFEMNAKTGKISLSLNSNEKNSTFEILVNSKDNDSTFILKVSGKTIIHNTDKIIVVSEKSIETAVTDLKGKIVAKTSLSSENKQRFLYEDEFQNSLKITDEKWMIRADKSKKIDLGDGKERAVLGETLKSIWEEYDQAFAKMTVSTAFGPSSTRINGADFEKVTSKFKDFLSNILNLD